MSITARKTKLSENPALHGHEIPTSNGGVSLPFFSRLKICPNRQYRISADCVYFPAIGQSQAAIIVSTSPATP